MSARSHPLAILAPITDEVSPMCVSCGCGKPNDNHGDPRHITMQQIQQAAEAIGKSPRDVAANIQQATSQK